VSRHHSHFIYKVEEGEKLRSVSLPSIAETAACNVAHPPPTAFEDKEISVKVFAEEQLKWIGSARRIDLIKGCALLYG